MSSARAAILHGTGETSPPPSCMSLSAASEGSQHMPQRAATASLKTALSRASCFGLYLIEMMD